METIFNDNFKWGNKPKALAHCSLRMFDNPKINKTVVVSQSANAKAGSIAVTGFVALANTVQGKCEIPPSQLVWIEHFPQTVGQGEAFDLVTLQWLGNSFKSPQRRRILRAFAEELAGESLQLHAPAGKP